LDIYHDCLTAVSTARIEGHLAELVGVRHPQTAPQALERAAQYLRDRLGALGYRLEDQTFEDGGREFANVLALKPGTRRPERRVLVLAHFDTVAGSPGADDNASGVAVLLEAAEVLSRLDLRQSVLFAGVNLEENACDDPQSGLRGSSALAVLASERGWGIEAVLVLESVGYAGPDVPQTVPAGIPVEVPKAGDFIAVIGNEAGRDAVAAFCGVVERCRLPLPYLPLLVPGNGELLPDTRRSDHAPFWDLGYPAVMLTDTTNFRSPHYHRETDTAETLNLSFATEVCRAVVGTVMALAEAEGTAAGS